MSDDEQPWDEPDEPTRGLSRTPRTPHAGRRWHGDRDTGAEREHGADRDTDGERRSQCDLDANEHGVGHSHGIRLAVALPDVGALGIGARVSDGEPE
ncbi:hypothetical protein FH969_10980, partial [Miniimonas arenae]